MQNNVTPEDLKLEEKLSILIGVVLSLIIFMLSKSVVAPFIAVLIFVMGRHSGAAAVLNALVTKQQPDIEEDEE